MKNLTAFLQKYFNVIVLFMLILLFFRTCGNDARTISKKVDKLSDKIDTLQSNSVTKTDLQMEGLKTEKRMIQSTDRKMLDVTRQAEIDKELTKLQK